MRPNHFYLHDNFEVTVKVSVEGLKKGISYDQMCDLVKQAIESSHIKLNVEGFK